LQEISETIAPVNLLSGGIDEVFQRTDSSGARSFLTDALGSTVALTDSTGTLQTQYMFDPFGNTSASGTATTNSFAYTGRELDAAGLYFYRARYYSPSLGRFISEDPLEGNDANRYGYVGNNPINGRDPLGLWGTIPHNNLIWNALKPCGVDNNTIHQFQQISEAFDTSWDSQLPINAYKHSMRSKGQSPQDAIYARNMFIADSLASAGREYERGGDWQTPFAQALHTLMDMTSPMHMENGVPLIWPDLPNAAQHGDWNGSGENWAHMTPALEQQNIDMIRGAYQSLTKKKCACPK